MVMVSLEDVAAAYLSAGGRERVEASLAAVSSLLAERGVGASRRSAQVAVSRARAAGLLLPPEVDR